MRSAMHREHRLQHRGFSLIEIMVGVVIGLIAVLVIYQVFAAAEGIKRNTTSVGDAQQNGLLSSFILGIELANASNGVADAMAQLGTCTATADPATTFRPIPLLITDGGGDANPDSFVVNYSVSQRVVTPVEFFGAATAGSDYEVHSLTGFRPGDLMVAISMKGRRGGSEASGAGRGRRRENIAHRYWGRHARRSIPAQHGPPGRRSTRAV
jgi:type IV pilus assembly protein PilW